MIDQMFQMDTVVGGTTANTTANATMQETLSASSETPMILIGMNNKIVSVNAAAAHLIGTTVEALKGQSVATLGQALAAVAMQPTKPGASTLLQIANGRTVLANTRTVVGQHNKPLGRAVTLQDISSAVNDLHSQKKEEVLPTVGNLQKQIQNMRDLIEMVPRFSNNKYWQDLLVEHMQKLVADMTSQVNQLSPHTA